MRLIPLSYWSAIALAIPVIVSLFYANFYLCSECLMTNEVSSQVSINMPRSQAWEKLRDLSLAHNYVPGLVKTEVTTELKEGVGASRKVFQTETKGINETVIEWQDGHGFLIRLHRGDKGAPPPFKEAFFRYQLDDGDSSDTTILTTSMSYTMGMGFVGSFLEKLFLKNIFNGVILDVAISLKQFYETGEKVTPAILKQVKADYKKAAS
jgi:hypothetical protein